MRPGRNIVHVTVDSLRADHCGWLGGTDGLTPTLDRMARNGVRYENAMAPGPTTHDSMPEIFTGTPMYTTSMGVDKQTPIREHLAKRYAIPERLSDLGYETVGFSSNVFASRPFGYDAGFDRFRDFFENDSLAGRVRGRIVSRWMSGKFVGGLRFLFNMTGLGEEAVGWRDLYDELLDTVESLPEPFYLWIFLMEPHWPYRPTRHHRNGVGTAEMYRLNWKSSSLSDMTPTEDDGERLRTLYGGTIADVDEFVDSIRADLEPYDPVYVFHADHGEAFGEHGSFGHGSYLYEENVRVPLLFGNVDDREAISRPITLRRLPSILSDIAAEGSVDWAAQADDVVVSKAVRDGEVPACARGEDWKLYRMGDGRTELFDLATDGDEREGRPVSDRELEDALLGPVDRTATETATIRSAVETVRQ